MTIADETANAQFCAALQRRGWAAGPWTSDYAGYEWQHLRHLLAAYGIELAGARVLEFGFNIGASSIVMARLGADVDAVDVDPDWMPLARSNAARYGLAGIRFCAVDANAPLPYADAVFDFVLCNSVLEYVEDEHFEATQRELARVLAPGGRLLVCGTASALMPKEPHSGVWLANWLPYRWHRIAYGRRVQKGVMPWTLRRGPWRGWRNLDHQDGGRAYGQARAAFGAGPAQLRWIARLAALVRPFGISVGLLAPWLSVLLQRPGGQKLR